jgi:hypothetical protein
VVESGAGIHQEQRKEQARIGKGETARGKKRSESFLRSTCIKRKLYYDADTALYNNAMTNNHLTR